MTMNNGMQFDGEGFKHFCEDLGIKVHFASVYHSQLNGAMERANGIIFACVARHLQGLPKGKWVEELPKVLWSVRTTITRPTSFTPFCLLFGEEAMTPEECKNRSFRVVNELAQSEELTSKDALEEMRIQAAENLTKYQEETRRWRDKKVSLKDFAPEDLVLQRLNNASAMGKLQSKFYHLAIVDGDELLHTWNADNHSKFYV